MTANIKVQQSRFALLKVEDDDDDAGETKSSQGGKNNQQQSKNKNKKRKKKTTQDDELKNMAFGLRGASNHRPQSAQSTDSLKGNKGGKKNKGAKPEQWEEWKKVDDQQTAGFYEKDLQQALLLSKMEFEQNKNQKGDSKTAGKSNDQPPEGKDSKKKSKKDKPLTMSLDEFNSSSKAKSYTDELEDLPCLSPVSHKVDTPDAVPSDVKYFDTVDDDVHKILQKEKIQEEYQKQYAVESVMSNKYKNDLSKKDKEIEFLRATVGKLEDELKQVKKRNKQLCVILAQGEMKDKAEVLMQVNQLGEVRDELTEQVTNLTAELEKERSKVHALKADIDKQKGGKHVGK
ncbi:G kinase-anchoring protein 1-like [Mizuhopecten yessoensis]|uniref:G kinase-anchoring protein 1 n=1 Tax=Mizuhopecten yessoensis TaxID=6573 RepID=A0A210QYW8_MIZYE|nr:G kinase-anchoring protein 1-like [Mizuhopecten yessoensis]OWF53949.1 G kinase-anchoring protein 1 [Mizuhopecten yessoensis]